MNNLLIRSLRRALPISLIIIIFTIVYLINIGKVISGLKGLFDFGSFIASGQLASQGENPYTADSPLIFAVTFPGINHSGVAPNLNPPISVLIFEQAAKFSPNLTVQVWRVFIILIYIYVFYILIKSRLQTEPKVFWRAIWFFSLAGFWHTVELGQLYSFLLLLVTGIIVNLEKSKHVTAGILLGVLIAIKPNFIFWAVALGMIGYLQIFLFAGFTAIFISLIPIYYYGFKIYQQWIEASRIFTPDLLIFPANNSFQGLTAHFGSAQTGIAISVIVSLTVLLIIYKFNPTIININTIAIITSLFISPIAWTGYTILMTPTFLETKKWKPAHWISACIFSFPFYLVLVLFQKSFFNFVFFGWFYGWGLLLLLLRTFIDIFADNASKLRQ